ncbi:MAG: hypothetical protein ACYTG0_44295, partial [Planctomycetota bacterium]
MFSLRQRVPSTHPCAVLLLTAAVLWATAPAAEQGAAGRLDVYGGYRSISAEATGFFRVERIDGRWWLVTPDGHGFLSAGVNHVDYKGDDSPAFVRFVTDHLRDWGFNTIGWSQELVGRDQKGMIHSRGWGPA